MAIPVVITAMTATSMMVKVTDIVLAYYRTVSVEIVVPDFMY